MMNRNAITRIGLLFLLPLAAFGQGRTYLDQLPAKTGSLDSTDLVMVSQVGEVPDLRKVTLAELLAGLSTRIDEIAALTPTDGGIIVGTGSGWTMETQPELDLSNATDLPASALTGSLTSSGGTLTTTDTTVDFSSAATSVFSLTVGGNAVEPFATLSESGDVLTATANKFELGTLATVGSVSLTPAAVTRSGVYADGTDEAVTIPSVWEVDFGAEEDFSFYLSPFRLPDYTPSSDVVLWQGISSNAGINIVLETTGALTLQLGDGSSTTDYTTNALLDNWPAWAELQVTLVADRSGNATFYVNGAAFEAKDISGQEDDDLSAGQDYVLLDAAEGYALGYAAIFNRTLTAAEVALAYQMPDWISRQVPVDMAGDGDAYSQRAEAAATTHWAASGSGLLVVSEVSEAGRTDVMKVVNQNVGGNLHLNFVDGLADVLSANTTYYFTADVYIPSTNTVWDGVWLYANTSSPVLEAGYNATTDAWITVSGTYTTGGSAEKIEWYPMNDGEGKAQGANTDVFYVDNMKIYGQGAVIMTDLTEAGVTKSDLIGWVDSASVDATRGTNAEDTLD